MKANKLVIKRVEEERDELQKKVDALSAIVAGFNKNSYVTDPDKNLLIRQLVYMELYLNILEVRLSLFEEEVE